MQKIAYIKRGLFSYTNVSVGRILTEHFPEFEIETIDVPDDLLRPCPQLVVVNLWHLMRLYGRDFARGQKKIRDSFYNTPYLFSKVRQFMRQRLGSRVAEFAFSFQTQSLYDVSVPGLPNFVYTDHTNLANRYYPGANGGKIFAEVWLQLEKEIYRNARRTFTMSHHVRRSVIEHYDGDPERVSCVHAGTNAMSDPIAPDNAGYSNQRILFIGKEWERKGGPELVEAFKIVRRKHPNARLVIAGCSPEVDLPSCEVVGRLPPEAVREQFSKASIFCMPSRIEPFGIVFLEALLNRIPVVAPRMGAVPDFIENESGGLLVEPGDIGQLAEALDSLLSDPAKCRRLGERGHEVVKERYSWDAVGRRMRTEILKTLEPRCAGVSGCEPSII